MVVEGRNFGNRSQVGPFRRGFADAKNDVGGALKKGHNHNLHS